MYLFDASDSVPEVRGGGGQHQLERGILFVILPAQDFNNEFIINIFELFYNVNFLYQISTQSSRTEVTELCDSKQPG